MDSTLNLVLALTAGAAIALAGMVGVTKVVHRAVMQWRGVKMAHYVAAVGEMVSRRMLPSPPPRAWAQDPHFHQVLADYRLLLTGADHGFVDELVDSLGVHEILIARIHRRPFQAGRLRALSSLVDLADSRHLEELRRLTSHSNRHVRVNAVRGLSRLGDLQSIEHILGLATGARPWESARMADAVAAMGAEAVDSISGWIAAETPKADPSVSVVALAARVLGLIGDPSASATLIALLRSGQAEWRLAAASALEHTGGEEAVAPLLATLDDDSWQVRARAAVALGAMADSTVGASLARLLTDEVWWVRQNAASALADVPGGTEHLVAALDSPDRFAADAALNQLAISGLLSEAVGHQDFDRHLVGGVAP